LNLARPGNAGLNYFTLVRPQQQVYNYIEQQQFLGTGSTGNFGTENLDPNLINRSRTPTFMGHYGYFGNVGGQKIGAPVVGQPLGGVGGGGPLGGFGGGNRIAGTTGGGLAGAGGLNPGISQGTGGLSGAAVIGRTR